MLNMATSLKRLEKDILGSAGRLLQHFEVFTASVPALDQQARDEASEERAHVLTLYRLIKEGTTDSSLTEPDMLFDYLA